MPRTADIAALLIQNEGVEPELGEFIASNLLDVVTWDAAGQPSRPVAEVVCELRSAYPFAFTAKPSAAPAAPAHETVTARVLRHHREAAAHVPGAGDAWSSAPITAKVLREAGRL